MWVRPSMAYHTAVELVQAMVSYQRYWLHAHVVSDVVRNTACHPLTRPRSHSKCLLVFPTTAAIAGCKVSTWKKKAGPTEVSARQESNWLVPAKSTTLASAKIFRKRLHTHWIETRAQLNGLVCVWFRAFLVELGIHISVLDIFTGCLYILYISRSYQLSQKRNIYIY